MTNFPRKDKVALNFLGKGFHTSPFSGVWSSGGGVPPDSAIEAMLTEMGRSVGGASLVEGTTAKGTQTGRVEKTVIR